MTPPRIGRRCYLCPGSAARARKWAKRAVHRAWRRMARRDPEDAPRRMPASGWLD